MNYPPGSVIHAERPIYDWNMIRYFDREEFECKCGGAYCNDTLPPVAEAHYFHLAWYFLDPLRKDVGSKAVISSAYRCPRHNANEGGRKRSYHTIPDNARSQHPSAVDFYFPHIHYHVAEIDVMRHTGNACLNGYHLYINPEGLYFFHIDFRNYRARWK